MTHSDQSTSVIHLIAITRKRIHDLSTVQLQLTTITITLQALPIYTQWNDAV